jgi:hypothetical protein
VCEFHFTLYTLYHIITFYRIFKQFKKRPIMIHMKLVNTYFLKKFHVKNLQMLHFNTIDILCSRQD